MHRNVLLSICRRSEIMINLEFDNFRKKVNDLLFAFRDCIRRSLIRAFFLAN